MKRILFTLTLFLSVAFASVNAQDNYDATTMGEKVYLETANWGQNTPFNKQVFTSYGETTNAKLGCVPTAYAIVMRYHGFPAEGTSKPLYNCQASTFTEITDRVYDFSKMPLSYNSNWSDEQVNEVSKFCSHILHACFPSKIGTSSTEVNEGQTSKVLNDYFNYQLINASYQANFTIEQWAEKLRESIDNGCPVPYASDNSGTGDTRHMFVVDGYTTKGYFHFNFGWNGSGNGWFKLDNITPSQGDNYSWNNGSEHYALFNLAPNKTMRTVTASISPAGAGTVAINDGTFGNSVNAEVMEGTKATLTAVANNGYTFSHWSKAGVLVSTEKSCKIGVVAEDNYYVANFLTVGSNRVNVNVTYNSDYGTVTYNSNAVSGTGITPYQNSEVTLVATPLDGYVFNGWTVTNGTNSTNYTGNELTFVAADEMSVTANFSLAVIKYDVTASTLTKSGNQTGSNSYCSTYTFNNGVAFTLTTTKDDVEAYALTTSNDNIDFYARATTKNNSENLVTDITYTLEAPNGYLIKEYSFGLKAASTASNNYTININYGNNSATIDNSGYKTIAETNIGTQSVEFTLSSDYTNRTKAYVESFTVTLQKEGASIPETPETPVTPPAPVTYTITATANPATGGSVSPASSTVNAGESVTLTATPNTNYAFAGWYNGTNKVSDNTTYTVSNVNANATYVAQFNESVVEPEQPGGTETPTTNLAGKYFRIKVKNTTNYMNVANTNNNTSSTSGITLVAKSLNSNTQIFLFEQSGNGYKLKAQSGAYIKCHAWNANANATNANDATELTFEPAGGELEYLIKWDNKNMNNGVERDDYFKYQNVNGTLYVFCDQPSNNAATWVLEEVTYCTITATAGNGGTVDSATSKVEVGTSVTLTATPNTGYTFAGWYNGTNKVSANATYTFTASETATYTAQFEAAVEPEDIIAGKCFRLKEKETGTYMNVYDNDTHAEGVKGGVNVTTLNKYSEAQIFKFIKNGDNYKLQSETGYYINCQQWNVDANSTTSGADLTLEPTANELEYLIKCSSGYFKIGAVQNNTSIGNFVYCDAASSAASTWVLEEAVLAVMPTISFKAEVEGWTSVNPNTHFGGITLTCDGVEKKITLTTANIEASVIELDVSGNNVSLAFTRKYRGLDFVGFSIDGTDLGKNPTLTTEQKNKLVAGTPLVAKFKTDGTDDVTLFYDDAPKSYRIPAIATTGTGRIIAISDYRHNLDDIGRDNHYTGTLRIDLVARMSDDNGATWNDTLTIAQGDNSKVGSYERAFGDAAIATYGENILVMAAAGDQLYPYASATSINRMARIFSSDNGVTWSHEEMSTKMYSTEQSLIPSGVAAFFGSGKLAVDPNYNDSGNPRIYGALLIKNSSRSDNNYVVYTDNFGATWNILGGSQDPIAYADEPKVEILPNGQILLSARRQGGRVFNIFTYNDKATNAGVWDSAENGCDNGGQNGTNGEIMCIDAKKIDGTAVKLLLQSQPKGGTGHYDRRDVTIWYKEISADSTYTPADIANNWIEGKQISEVLSSYSTMSLQNDGKIAFFFEEAPCYGDNYTKGYSMVYIPLTVEEITNSNYYGVNSELPEINEVHVVLTDANGNEYNEVLDAANINAIETTLTTKYSYITLGTNGNIVQNNDGTYTYTNTVALPFAVSNENVTVWHNIYWPANTNENGYPVYLSASSADDQYVPKVTEGYVYGNSSYNTLNNNDKISWAIYSVDKGFAFTFKNKVTGKYIQATSVASGNAKNVEYVDEDDATAFAIVEKTGSYKGDYALVAEVNGNTGYLCSTSVTGYHYATHYSGNGHQGAWVKFEEPDYEAIIAQINDALASVNNGIYTLAAEKNTTYNDIKNAMKNSGNVKLNTLKDYLTDVATLFEGATLNKGKYYRFKAYNNSNAYMVSNGISTRMTVNTNPDNAASIFYINDDNQPVNYKYGIGVKDTYNSGSVTSTKETFTFTTNNNGFVITTNTQAVNNNNNGQYVYHHAIEGNVQIANVNRNSQAAGDRTTWLVEAVASLPVTISSAGYATLYAPVALEVPTGVTAYTVEINGEWATLNEIEGRVIPANTGVVLHGNPDTYYFVITTTGNRAESKLRGSVEAKYIEEDAYVLTLGDDGEACFGIAEKNQQNSAAFLNNSHKAYLPKPVGSNVASYSFRFPDTTAVEEVETENTEVVIYDLSGRRINEITEGGVYIVNGKKILVK